MSNGQRILIFTGGNLGKWALQEIKGEEFLVGVDKGAIFLIQNGFIPDLVLGDLDSVTEEELTIIQKKCPDVYSCDPIHKDNTDTDLAMIWAIAQKPEEILLLGATGSRLDHTLANIHLLVEGLKKDIPCKIKDMNNQIQLIDKKLSVPKENFNYVSLLPLSLEVTGITLEGFQYPLNNATLRIGNSLGISNKLVSDIGRISINTGLLLIIQSKD